MDAKRTAALHGIAFITFLAVSYFENMIFFSVIGNVVSNQFLSVAMLFVHNILAVSLILLGMTLYVNLVVLDFFKREKYAHIVLEHPRTFAIVFTIIILLLSILRVSSLTYGGISVGELPLILLISAPIGIIEGYGIFLTINKTLSRTMSIKGLAHIYGVFFIAAIIEVGFINLLVSVTTG